MMSLMRVQTVKQRGISKEYGEEGKKRRLLEECSGEKKSRFGN